MNIFNYFKKKELPEKYKEWILLSLRFKEINLRKLVKNPIYLDIIILYFSSPPLRDYEHAHEHIYPKYGLPKNPITLDKQFEDIRCIFEYMNIDIINIKKAEKLYENPRNLKDLRDIAIKDWADYMVCSSSKYFSTEVKINNFGERMGCAVGFINYLNKTKAL